MLPGFIINGVSHPNVIVNKSYEYNGNNKYINNLCDENRECCVEIVPNELNDLNVTVAKAPPTLVMMAENRGYDVVTVSDPNGSGLPNGNGIPNDGSKETAQSKQGSRKGKKQLSSEDLLNFAKQIATGMVIKFY